MLAREGRTLVTENARWWVQAAAGVDGSDVGSTEWALLPLGPDARGTAPSAARSARGDCRCGVHDRTGVAPRPDRLRSLAPPG